MSGRIEAPARIAQNLKQDKQGRYVPWFVAWVDGVPDFRVADSRRTVEAARFDLCYICGQRRGRFATFPVGPMCTVNRTSPEPPSHKECAIYSAKVCPFLSNPEMKRGPRDLPPGATREGGAGMMICRNPGVTAIWTTRRFSIFADHKGFALFDIGEPEEVIWLARGREATRAEVLDSIDSGLPILRDVAEKHDGTAGMAELDRRHKAALAFIPAP